MELFAAPYDTSANGFYFKSQEDFDAKYAANFGEWGDLVEEYEISFIEGTPEAGQLAIVWGLTALNFGAFIDLVEEGDTRHMAQVYYHLWDNRGDLEGALEAEDGILWETDSCFGGDDAILEAYAEEYAEDCGLLKGMPESLRCYFDFKAFGRDMRLGGDVSVFEFCGTYYVWDNHA